MCLTALCSQQKEMQRSFKSDVHSGLRHGRMYGKPNKQPHSPLVDLQAASLQGLVISTPQGTRSAAVRNLQPYMLFACTCEPRTAVAFDHHDHSSLFEHQWMAKLAWPGSYTAKRPSHPFFAWRELQRIPKIEVPSVSLPGCCQVGICRSTTLGQAQPHTQARTAPRKLYKESKLLSNRHR